MKIAHRSICREKRRVILIAVLPMFLFLLLSSRQLSLSDTTAHHRPQVKQIVARVEARNQAIPAPINIVPPIPSVVDEVFKQR